MGQLLPSDRSDDCESASPEQDVMTFAPATDAEALNLLRASFRDRPLSLRVTVLDFLMRRRRGNSRL